MGHVWLWSEVNEDLNSLLHVTLHILILFGGMHHCLN